MKIRLDSITLRNQKKELKIDTSVYQELGVGDVTGASVGGSIGTVRKSIQLHDDSVNNIQNINLFKNIEENNTPRIQPEFEQECDLLDSGGKRKNKRKIQNHPSLKKSKIFANAQIESLRKTSETKNHHNDTVDPIQTHIDTGIDADAFAEDFFKSENSDAEKDI